MRGPVDRVENRRLRAIARLDRAVWVADEMIAVTLRTLTHRLRPQAGPDRRGGQNTACRP